MPLYQYPLPFETNLNKLGRLVYRKVCFALSKLQSLAYYPKLTVSFYPF